jgi:hypothetical protein
MTDDKRTQDNIDPQTRSEIGQKGGQAAQESGNAHELTNEEQSEGGIKSSSDQDMSELGRQGGQN